MSSLRAANLATRDGTYTTSMENPVRGSARAWCKADTAGNNLANFNVSSVTDIGVGTIEFNFATALPNANYVALPSIQVDSGATVQAYRVVVDNTTPPTTTKVRCVCERTNGTAVTGFDPNLWMMAVFSA